MNYLFCFLITRRFIGRIFLFKRNGGGPGGVFGSTSPNEVNIFSLHGAGFNNVLQVVLVFCVLSDLVKEVVSILRGCKI
jgi:hypothetical protein